jgi:Uri superfamily endonuclease
MDNKAGTYALILQSNEPETVDVGRLGQVSIQVGYYVYVGSAHCSGGLSARVGRHLSRAKKIHWHIDYLTLRIPVIAVWYMCSTQRYEHEWATFFAGMPESEITAKGFGSSDCRCVAHLFYFKTEPDFFELKSKFGQADRLCL